MGGELDQEQVGVGVIPVPGASGRATLIYDTTENRLSWVIRFDQLSGAATAVRFQGPVPPDDDVGEVLDAGAIGGTTSPSVGTATISDEQEADLLAGRWSIDVSTDTNAGGEIRGQVEETLPRLIAYQGLLRDAAGELLTGNVDFRFRIFDVQGLELWSESHTLPVLQSAFSVLLGSKTLFDPAIVDFSRGYFLQVEVRNDGGAFEVLTPRTPLVSSAYARRAASVADGAVGTASLAPGSVTASRLSDGSVTRAALGSDAVSSGQIADGSVMDVDLANGSVKAEKIANGAVDTHHLRDGSVKADQIQEKAVNPLVHLGPGNASDGAYLTYNAGAERWEAGVLIVSPTFLAPGSATDGDILRFSGAEGHWRPEAFGDGFSLPLNDTHDGPESAFRVVNPGTGPAGEFAGGLVVHGEFSDGAPTRALGVSNDSGAHAAIFSNDCSLCSTPVLELQGSTTGPFLNINAGGGTAARLEGDTSVFGFLQVEPQSEGANAAHFQGDVEMGAGLTVSETFVVSGNGEVVEGTGIAAQFEGDTRVVGALSVDPQEAFDENTPPIGHFQGNVQVAGSLNVTESIVANASSGTAGRFQGNVEVGGGLVVSETFVVSGNGEIVEGTGIAAQFEGDTRVVGALSVDPQQAFDEATPPIGHFQGNVQVAGSLNVSGAIRSGGTTLDVPDYVFEPDYPLMPLDELLAFVAAERHLPDIPSKDDQDGWRSLSLQERDMRLLEKVEELTLYIGELQARIKKLERQLQR